MQIKIHALAEMSEAERQLLQNNLASVASNPDNMTEEDWYITLENNAVMISILIRKGFTRDVYSN
ncbi:MAG: hypothetical protein HYZ49_05030 [Chloroflexi bacterium]|nr:hypothetical protein [Chloroflexota bacterium]